MTRPFRLAAARRSEHDLQMEVTRTLAVVLGGEVAWTAIDHANAKDALTGAIRKARGVKPGLPDFTFGWQGAPRSWIELKTSDGALSVAQRQRHAEIRAVGERIAVCRSTMDVLRVLTEWGCPMRARIAA